MLRKITMTALAAGMLNGCVMQSTYDRDVGYERQLNEQLRQEVAADEVKIQQLEDRLRVTMEDELLFPEGGWQISKEGKAAIDKIVSTLQSATKYRIEVEGHTDNVPIGKHLAHRFSSNWELSAGRAAEVVKYLQSKGVDPSRMTAAGHGEYEPVASNATAEGKAENRRIDIDLVPIYKQ